MNYRADILISGALIQKVYGSNLERVKREAVRRLTRNTPGFGGTHPDRLTIYQSLGRMTGNRSRWMQLCCLQYSDIPEHEREWVKRRKAKETALAMNPL